MVCTSIKDSCSSFCTSLKSKSPSCDALRHWTPDKALKVAGIIFIISALFITTAALAANLPASHEVFYTVGGVVGGLSLTAFLMVGVPKFIRYCRGNQG